MYTKLKSVTINKTYVLILDMEVSMRKVIYFDESSALDLIDIVNKGRSQKIIEDIVEKAKGLEAKGGLGTGILDLLTTGFTGGFKGGLSRNKESIVSITITNTILTSFLELINKKNKENIELSIINTKSIEIIPESATYIKVIAPFAKIFKEVNEIQNSEITGYENIDFHSMDDVLANAKGYYELVATNQSNEKFIVRFNLDGFRNNYRIQDLQRMNLTLYGVIVGSTNIEMLNFKNELDTEPTKQFNLGFSAFDNPDNPQEGTLNIVDVIFAGVK